MSGEGQGWGEAGRTVKHSVEAVERMKELSLDANPWAAFALGFFFGAIGIAIYFRSWKDFFVCVGLFLLLTLVMPYGPGEIVGWLFAAFYGAWRAHTSNQKRLGHKA
jgi:hypothetical protein